MARISVVDDDHMIRDLLHTTLSFGRQEIVEAEDATGALERFRDTPPDVVVLDLDLPGEMSGLELLETLKAQGARARFIVLTGSGPAREPKLRSAGAIGYLTKPFSPLALIQEIEAAIDSH